jgi:argininosuccinate synthase
MKEKVLLAFSGGLDTSFCAMYLAKEKGYEVHTAVANTGGFSAEDLKVIEDKAMLLGAVRHVAIDVTQEYYEKSIKYMVFGNVYVTELIDFGKSERIFQAIAIINHAKNIGADYVAH